MGEKEVEFYRRVKRYRVDPAGGSVANPVPGESFFFCDSSCIAALGAEKKSRLTEADYYGEKIASVAGYRQWLKDQRAFNKKRHTYV